MIDDIREMLELEVELVEDTNEIQTKIKSKKCAPFLSRFPESEQPRANSANE